MVPYRKNISEMLAVSILSPFILMLSLPDQLLWEA